MKFKLEDFPIDSTSPDFKIRIDIRNEFVKIANAKLEEWKQKAKIGDCQCEMCKE